MKGSHMTEPPIRIEIVTIEWKCDKCVQFGKASLPIHEHAHVIFSRMKINHDNQSRPRNDKGGPLKSADPACKHLVFQWARIQ